ncbi:MAG: hypothetical protein JWM22_2729 [Frankiales bacterium]|nr:hypothetical protein [Frankiales bacterium]
MPSSTAPAMTTQLSRDSFDASVLAADFACTAFADGVGVGESVDVTTVPRSTGDVVMVPAGVAATVVTVT